MSLIKKIDHLVITTSHIKECLEFYQKLGFEVKDGLGRYELFAGDFKINVHIKDRELEPYAKHVQPGSADLCFEVDDIISFEQLLNQQCIQIELGIVDRYGVKGIMDSIYIRDIDGNLLEFSQYKKD
ncbi:MAG: VOC family protein [Coprobacillus sp.]